MVYKYFIGVKDETELSSKYKALAKTLHPDVGGKHEDFVAMKAEYEHILNLELYPVNNIATVIGLKYEPVTKPTKEKASFTEQEINNFKAENYFRERRFSDLTYDTIDDIIGKKINEGLHNLWAYQELQKQYSLTLDHFKYLAWKLNDPMTIANTVFKKYQMI